jgi:ATP phosphoribosyltransferase
MAALEHLIEQIEARIRATSRMVLRFSVPSERAAVARQQLTAKHGCVLSSWSASAEPAAATPSNGRDFAVALCPRPNLYNVVKFLKTSGAAGIIVDRGEFIFEGSSQAFDTFRQVLKRRDAAANGKAAADN